MEGGNDASACFRYTTTHFYYISPSDTCETCVSSFPVDSFIFPSLSSSLSNLCHLSLQVGSGHMGFTATYVVSCLRVYYCIFRRHNEVQGGLGFACWDEFELGVSVLQTIASISIVTIKDNLLERPPASQTSRFCYLTFQCLPPFIGLQIYDRINLAFANSVVPSDQVAVKFDFMSILLHYFSRWPESRYF